MLLFGSLKICADSWEKGETKITEVNEIAVVYNFFQRQLSVARPVWTELAADETRTFTFQGKSQSLQFVSSFPASAGKTGLQLFFLELLQRDKEQFINVSITPFFPVNEGEQWHKEEAVLIKQVSALAISYFGSEDGVTEGFWRDEWLEKEQLPQLVKISLKLDNGLFCPDMIIPLKVTYNRDSAETVDGLIEETPTEETPAEEVTQ